MIWDIKCPSGGLKYPPSCLWLRPPDSEGDNSKKRGALARSKKRGALASGAALVRRRRPLAAPNLAEGNSGGDRDIERADPADLRDVGRRGDRAKQGGRAAVVLVPDRQANVALQRRLEQRHRARRELDGPHADPVLRRGLGRGRRGRLAVGREEPVGAKGGLAHRREVQVGRVAAQPDGLHAERGGRPHDRADVERLADRVKQQREPPLGAPPPLPVWPLPAGRPHLLVLAARGGGTRYAGLIAGVI